MGYVLSENKKQQVIALGRLEWSLRRIGAATGVDRRTARGYLVAAGVPIRSERGRRAPNCTSESEGVITGDAPRFTVDFAPESASKLRQSVITGAAEPFPSTSACNAHREFIEQSLERGRNAMAIWQDLVTDYGFTAKYSSVQRFVRRLEPSAPDAHPRMETAPGEEAQVDYGEGPMVLGENGRYVRTRLFVLTLACSRKSVWLLTFKSSSKTWCELHEEAFRRLGGAVRIVVLDNLKEGVIKPDFYDPVLNPLYKDMLAHYGATALPARPYDPNRKGKVESAVGHAQKTPLRGQRFETLADAQAYLDRWQASFADTRIHGTKKRQVAAMFAEEQPFLVPMPSTPFRYYQHGRRKVHLDGCVEIDSAYYGAPLGRIGTELLVQWDSLVVRLLDPKTGELLREHVHTQPGHFRVAQKDLSSRMPPSTAQTLERAWRIGKNIGALCAKLHHKQGELGMRRILGVLSLAKKHGAASLDHACRTALDMNVIDYRFVRRCVERQLPPALALKQIDPIIRELSQYRDIINNMNKETLQ
jgi:transposase